MLKQLREKKGLTQADVAKRLGFGNAQFVSNIERGLAKLPVKHFKKVAALYGVPVERLIDLKLKQTEIQLKKYFKLS